MQNLVYNRVQLQDAHIKKNVKCRILSSSKFVSRKVRESCTPISLISAFRTLQSTVKLFISSKLVLRVKCLLSLTEEQQMNAFVVVKKYFITLDFST